MSETPTLADIERYERNRLARIELCILEVLWEYPLVLKLSEIQFDGELEGEEFANAVGEKYGGLSQMDEETAAALVGYLEEERYLFRTSQDLVTITPKGEKRLRQLQHPVRHWVKANWFPVAVVALGVVAIVADALIKIFVD